MKVLPMSTIIYLTLVFFVTVESQSMTKDALRSIFKYADLAKVKSLTQNLNRDKTVDQQKKRVDTWSEKNFLSSNKTVKPPAKDPYSKKDVAVKKASQGIYRSQKVLGNLLTSAKACNEFRNAVRQFVQYMFTEINGKFVKEPVAKQVRKMYWNVDKKNKNNYQKTYKEFLGKLDSKLPKEKKGKVAKAQMEKIDKDFYKNNPKLQSIVKDFKI